MNINLLVEPSKKIEDYSEQKAINNRVGLDVKITIKDMLDRALKDFKSYDKDTLAKFNNLLSIIQTAKIKEIIATGLTEKTFNKDKWSQTEENKIILSFAMIFKFSPDEAKTLGLRKNAVILNCYSSTQNNKEFITLKRVDFLNLPFVEIKNTFVSEMPKDWSLSLQTSKAFLDGSATWTPFHDFWRNGGTQRLKDIFFDDNGVSGDKNLHVQPWYAFLGNFRRFLKDKQKNGAYHAFALSGGEINKNVNIVLESQEDIKKIFESNPSLKFSLMSDAQVSFEGNIVSISDFDFKEHINNEIKNILQTKNDIQTKLSELKNEIDIKKNARMNEESIANEMNSAIDNHKTNIQEKNDFIKSLDNDIFTNKNKINELKREIDKELSKTKKNKNKISEEINEELIASRREMIDDKENLIREIESDKNSIEAKLVNLKNELREMEHELAEKREAINVARNIISSIQKRINEQQFVLENTNTQINNREKTLKIISKNLYYKCTVNVKEKELSEDFSFIEFDYERFVKSDYDAENIFWNASTYDDGFAKIFTRYYDGFGNLKNGAYKNPYLVTALNNPGAFRSKEISGSHKLRYEPVKGLGLNEKQIDAVETALNTSSIAFLQGPPGTGKTQVISGLAMNLINNDENILISSSTHEAINNAFDRIHDISINNPNVFFWKMISNYRLKKGDVKDGEMVYRENKMRYNFYNAIDRYIIGDNKEDDNKLLKLINDLLSSQDEINKVVSDEAFELLVDKKYNNNENLKYIQKYYAEPGAEQMFVSNPDNYINLIIAANKKDQRQRMIYKPLHEKFTEFMNLVRSVYTPTIDDLFNNFELLSKVKNILASKNSSNLIDKFKKINYEFNDNYETQAEINRNKKFADLVFENELINVIGITTTAPQQLIVGGKKKMLFTEYQVDYEIIDEVSKSSTAELINASILSGRILYCGDYRQIQPQDNLSTHALYKEWLEKNKSVHDELVVKPESLIKTPIFKLLSLQLVEASEKEIYRFLNVQHRFTENIMDVVNNVYLDSEQLEMPANPRTFNEYNFEINGSRFHDDTAIIDTTHMSGDVMSEFRNYGIKINNDYSFDSKKSILLKNRIFNSRINETDALAVIKTLESMFEAGISPSSIGVITITRSQAQLIKSLAQSRNSQFESKIRGVAIDTVDNFQGREKEIIIVDFVNAKSKLDSDKNSTNVFTPERRDNEYLEAVERLNVAISRARAKLIMIGSFEYYKTITSKLDIGTNGKSKTVPLFENWMDEIENQGGTVVSWKEIA